MFFVAFLGGLLREWYGIMAREMFNPNYALFTISQGEKSTYLPNRNSHCNPNHLSYFKFAGRIVAKAIYDNKLIDSYFTRSFYKHILGKPVHYTDMEAEDYGFYQGLVYLLEHDISDLGYEITFSAEVRNFIFLSLTYSLPRRHLLVQSQRWKHQKNAEIFSKLTRKTQAQCQMMWFLSLYC